MDDHPDPLQADVWAMRGKLAAVCESAMHVSMQYQDWLHLGIPDHMPDEVTRVRLDALQDALEAVALDALAGRLAVECVRARLNAPAGC